PSVESSTYNDSTVSPMAGANYQYDGGVYRPSSYIYGAFANITYKSKPVVNNYSMSSAWAMIDKKEGPQLAQTGYAVDKARQDAVYYFMGIINSDNQYVEYTTGYGPAIGSTHEYRIQADSSGNVYGLIDGTRSWAKTIDWVPNSAQYQGEIYNTDAQFIGKSALRERINNVRYLQPSGTWVKPSMTSWLKGTYAGLDNANYTASGYFDVWDTRY
ncbi:hypothetical protein, partial [[Kitasatospora] papulosa]|uniref:hypothetical protein n=1 Tax=[Kitasatospora] papulosa TaxID=1464011 RepID=UPI0036F0B2B7